MKLIRTFEITEDEFYDYLEKNLCEDIHRTTNKKVSPKQIKKGFTYEKKELRTKIIINDYVRGSIYSTTARSLTDYVTVTYTTKQTEEGLEIIFEQFMSGYDDVRDQKNFLSRTWHDWVTFGRMSQTLYGIQDEIIALREGRAPVKPMQPIEPLKGIRKKLNRNMKKAAKKIGNEWLAIHYQYTTIFSYFIVSTLQGLINSLLLFIFC